MNREFSWESFERMPIVGIMRNLPARSIDTLALHYVESGLTNLEITMNTAGAEAIISSLVKHYGQRLNIGAGTVCTLNDLDKALSAGAQFIVSPILNEEVIKGCVKENIPIFPGAYTPTEIYKAWQMGASMVKVFPASGLGVSYIKEVLAPLNSIKLFPTGGITLDNCKSYLEAGAKGLGLGSHLFPKELLEAEKWEELIHLFKQFVNKVESFQHRNK
jgi:2-dehydro-3-deoxyphosphogluconate aldolase/(4S)-4-hydroxy-2-oxoglutarate aldolase